jgi:hypothetical protein
MDCEIPNGPGYKTFPFEYAAPQCHAVRQASYWSYCGPSLSVDGPGSLPPSFKSWERDSIDGSLASSLIAFLTFAHELLDSLDIKYYWLTVRASPPTKGFRCARWHTDDYFLRKYNATNRNDADTMTSTPPPSMMPLIDHWGRILYDNVKEFFHQAPTIDSESTDGPKHDRARGRLKLCTTLLGPGTLFLKQGELGRSLQRQSKQVARNAPEAAHACAGIGCLDCTAASLRGREWLAEALHEYDVEETQLGQCALFKAGEDEGALHSEPPWRRADRIFVNLIPGTKDEMKEMMGRWGMEFPRDWSLVHPQMRHANDISFDRQNMR